MTSHSLSFIAKCTYVLKLNNEKYNEKCLESNFETIFTLHSLNVSRKSLLCVKLVGKVSYNPRGVKFSYELVKQIHTHTQTYTETLY